MSYSKKLQECKQWVFDTYGIYIGEQLISCVFNFMEKHPAESSYESLAIIKKSYKNDKSDKSNKDKLSPEIKNPDYESVTDSFGFIWRKRLHTMNQLRPSLKPGDAIIYKKRNLDDKDCFLIIDSFDYESDFGAVGYIGEVQMGASNNPINALTVEANFKPDYRYFRLASEHKIREFFETYKDRRIIKEKFNLNKEENIPEHLMQYLKYIYN